MTITDLSTMDEHTLRSVLRDLIYHCHDAAARYDSQPVPRIGADALVRLLSDSTLPDPVVCVTDRGPYAIERVETDESDAIYFCLTPIDAAQSERLVIAVYCHHCGSTGDGRELATHGRCVCPCAFAPPRGPAESVE